MRLCGCADGPGGSDRYWEPGAGGCAWTAGGGAAGGGAAGGGWMASGRSGVSPVVESAGWDGRTGGMPSGSVSEIPGAGGGGGGWAGTARLVSARGTLGPATSLSAVGGDTEPTGAPRGTSPDAAAGAWGGAGGSSGSAFGAPSPTAASSPSSSSSSTRFSDAHHGEAGAPASLEGTGVSGESCGSSVMDPDRPKLGGADVGGRASGAASSDLRGSSGLGIRQQTTKSRASFRTACQRFRGTAGRTTVCCRRSRSARTLPRPCAGSSGSVCRSAPGSS